MKARTLAFLPLAATAFLLAATACSDTETEWVSSPSLTATTAAVAVPDGGGTVTIGYSIQNPADDGTVSASSDASWIADIDCSASGTITFTAAANTGSDPRTARISITYSYTIVGSKGSVSADITIAQSSADQPLQPSLSVTPAAIAATLEGGDYSFSFTVVNPEDGGTLSADADADWISNLTVGDNKVTFTVAENPELYMRTATIVLFYNHSAGTVTETVTVAQSHEPATDEDLDDEDDDGDVYGGDIEGDYIMTGISYYPDKTSWTMTIHYKPESIYTDSEYPYLVDGLVSYEEGDYAGDWHQYCTKAKFVNSRRIVIPAQITKGNYIVDWDTEEREWFGVVAGYLDDEGTPQAYEGYPDIVFKYDASTKTWICNYGIMGFLFPDEDDLNSYHGNFKDYTVGDITITAN